MARKLAWQPLFLAALEETHLVTEASKRAGIHRQRAYEQRASDPKFAEQWAEIEERSTELLEREAYRRAAVGVEKPVFQGGEEVGRVREFSDTLLIFLLKARRPDTYALRALAPPAEKQEKQEDRQDDLIGRRAARLARRAAPES